MLSKVMLNNAICLEFFLQFASKQRRKVHAKGFPVMEHMAILRDVDSISYVLETLRNITEKNEEAAAKALAVEREKNMADHHLFHTLYKKKGFERNDISSASFWNFLNRNAMPEVLVL